MVSTTVHKVRAGMWWAGVTVLTSGLFGAGLAHLSSQESLPGAPSARNVAAAVVDSHQRSYEVLGTTSSRRAAWDAVRRSTSTSAGCATTTAPATATSPAWSARRWPTSPRA